jgi:tRNA threonylcarbamoyladenosine modification (KEOPS) complex  Pcc1 subunit
MDIQEVRVGDRLLFAWDGRILEVFGALRASGSRRFHPAVTELRIDEPDRKGRVTITMNWHDANTTTMTVEAQDWERLRPLMETFAAAVEAAP